MRKRRQQASLEGPPSVSIGGYAVRVEARAIERSTLGETSPAGKLDDQILALYTTAFAHPLQESTVIRRIQARLRREIADASDLEPLLREAIQRRGERARR